MKFVPNWIEEKEMVVVAEIVGIKFGQSLPPERWMEAADNLEQVFPTIARRLELMNNDGMGKQDAREFMEDAMLSLVALRFVAANASECCRFIEIPKKMEGGEQK